MRQRDEKKKEDEGEVGMDCGRVDVSTRPTKLAFIKLKFQEKNVVLVV